jgi:hypothetical protein
VIKQPGKNEICAKIGPLGLAILLGLELLTSKFGPLWLEKGSPFVCALLVLQWAVCSDVDTCTNSATM